MTVLRQNAMRELERLPEDKIMFVLLNCKESMDCMMIMM